MKIEMKKQLFGFILMLSVFSMDMIAQSGKGAMQFEATYVSEVVSNFSGGIDQGVDYLGMIDLIATFDTEKAGLWKNGIFYVEMQNTHGGTPSGSHIGDIQVVSNIENGNFSYLYQLWYAQQFENFSFMAGIHDLNSEFLASEFAGEYINSSFGILPSVSLNVPVSIFPKTTLGWLAKFHPVEGVQFQLGMYDGDPMCIEDPMIQSFSFDKEEGHLTIGELSISNSMNEDYPGMLKVGAYYHSANCNSISTQESFNNNYGAYVILDQMIKPFNESGEKGIGFFGMIGVAPKERNLSNFSWGMGVNFMAPFTGRDQDLFGLAISSVKVQPDSDQFILTEGYETVIECMYKIQIGENLLFQPEIQYVMNPGGLHENTNACVGILRTYISF